MAEIRFKDRGQFLDWVYERAEYNAPRVAIIRYNLTCGHAVHTPLTGRDEMLTRTICPYGCGDRTAEPNMVEWTEPDDPRLHERIVTVTHVAHGGGTLGPPDQPPPPETPPSPGVMRPFRRQVRGLTPRWR